ncbi:MAG: hypothetical protein H0U43_07070 [Chthoniobacterales bacterium]|nr:hypothetical protein [Chthoniobacterales bacterium]
MLVGVNTKVRYKGIEYACLDDILHDKRRPLDRTLASLSGGSEIIASLNSRIILNGQTTPIRRFSPNARDGSSSNRSMRGCRSTPPSVWRR